MLKQRADLTFKHNLKNGRHGWLRLTPAYSVKVAHQILSQSETPRRVLDPFSGTGTTGLVCAEAGLHCDLIELNPFLAWFASAKTRNYTSSEIAVARQGAAEIIARAQKLRDVELWVPSIHHIERWWSTQRLATLAQIHHAIRTMQPEMPEAAADLLLIAFCRLTIDWSNAAFNHQSLSFKDMRPSLFEQDERALMLNDFVLQAQSVAKTAEIDLPGSVDVLCGDSREVNTITRGPYEAIITSPPYPNRMSYIRELRPYMYWLGYLSDGREAGELDWQAIGGTWGIATSRLLQWQSNGMAVEYEGFEEIVGRIAKSSPLLAQYVHKYFTDIARHLHSLKTVLSPYATVYYIVGNSKFYDVLVPVERIYASLLAQAGFSQIEIETLRKRNSKKELVEYCVKANFDGIS